MWFLDVTAESGIPTSYHGGYGSAWVDFDGDGWLDVWIGNHMYKDTLLRNDRNGRFSDITDTVFASQDTGRDEHGAAWADFDNDGDQDLAMLVGVDGGTKCVDKPFFVNVGGVLVDQADAHGLNDRCGRGRTPLWLDWNGDGLLDLYDASEKRPADDLSPARLMRQLPGAGFEEVPEMRLQGSPGAAQLAYLDGAVHLLVDSETGPFPFAFHRVGDPTAKPIRIAGLPNETLPTTPARSEVVVADFTGDLEDDILVLRTSNLGKGHAITADGRRLDFIVKGLTTPRGITFAAAEAQTVTLRLFTTKWASGDVRLGTVPVPLPTKSLTCLVHGFEISRCLTITLSADDPRLAGGVPNPEGLPRGVYVGRSEQGRWTVLGVGGGADWLQFDFVGDQGAVTDAVGIGIDLHASIARRPLLLVRNGERFEDRAAEWGLNKALACTSATAADFDNDGRLDLYLGCTNSVSNARNRLFRNLGDRFVEIQNPGGYPGRPDWPAGRVSAADFDNDGYVDLLLTEGCAVCGHSLRFGPRLLLKNLNAGSHWVQLELVGCESNRDGVGARVVVDAGDRRQMRLKGGGMRRGVQDQPRLHFGLGQALVAESVRVDWPSGQVTEHPNVPANAIHTLRERADCARE